MNVKRKTLEKFLNDYLEKDKIKDSSLNGLQVEGSENIKKIALGVSANLEFFKKSLKKGADTFITHHGLFWGKPISIKNYFKNRIKILLENNINLFAYHLPLDKHEKIGNNICLAKLLNLKKIKPFGAYNNIPIGFMGKLTKEKTLKEIQTIIEKQINTKANVLKFKNKKVSSIAIVSGGASSLINEAIDEDIDLFITGEITEYVQEICRESKVNYMHIGHYNSEKLGIKNLGKVIEKKFKVKTFFIDVPNPN
jgi:dinuclear metal center YbgI/SA1388 family protein